MSWKEIQFKDFVKLQRGFDLPVSRMVRGEIPVLGSRSIIGFHNEAKVTSPGVVTGRSGTLGLVQFSKKPFWPHNTALWVKDFKGNDPRFVYYKLQTLRLERFNGGVAVPTLNRNALDTIPIRIPERTEQERIASILSAYDDLIENNRRRIELLEKAARLIYEEWFIRFCFPGHENTKIVDDVPVGWERGILSDFYDTRTGGTPSRRSPEFFDGEINWVKTQELNEGFIFETEEKITEDGLNASSAKIFPINTVLVSIYAGTNIGRAGILAKPAACNQACVGLFPKHENSNHIYAHLFLQTVRKKLIGFSQGSAQTNISQQLLRKLTMLFPDRKLMREFLVIVSPIYEQIKNLQQQNLNLVKSRNILLPRLLNERIWESQL